MLSFLFPADIADMESLSKAYSDVNTMQAQEPGNWQRGHQQRPGQKQNGPQQVVFGGQQTGNTHLICLHSGGNTCFSSGYKSTLLPQLS